MKKGLRAFISKRQKRKTPEFHPLRGKAPGFVPLCRWSFKYRQHRSSCKPQSTPYLFSSSTANRTPQVGSEQECRGNRWTGSARDGNCHLFKHAAITEGMVTRIQTEVTTVEMEPLKGKYKVRSEDKVCITESQAGNNITSFFWISALPYVFYLGSAEKIENWRYREKTRAFKRICSVGYTPDLSSDPGKVRILGYFVVS